MISKDLILIIKKERLTYSEIAKKCGVSKSTISRIINGNVVCNIETAEKILKKLGYQLEISEMDK